MSVDIETQTDRNQADRNMKPAANYATIRTERIGSVQLIAYNQPERRNAWTVACIRETTAAISRANDDPGIGAIVLTGEGNSYCAGADMKGDAEFDPDTGRRLTPATFTMGTGSGNWIALLAASNRWWRPSMARPSASARPIRWRRTFA